MDQKSTEEVQTASTGNGQSRVVGTVGEACDGVTELSRTLSDSAGPRALRASPRTRHDRFDHRRANRDIGVHHRTCSTSSEQSTPAAIPTVDPQFAGLATEHRQPRCGCTSVPCGGDGCRPAECLR